MARSQKVWKHNILLTLAHSLLSVQALHIDLGPSRTVTVRTSLASYGTVQILPTLPGLTPATTGTVCTSLATSDGNKGNPLITVSISRPLNLLKAGTSTALPLPPVATPAMDLSDIFQSPIGTGSPPRDMKVRTDHPVPRTGIINTTAPFQTNKFYANVFLGDQRMPVYTYPYAVNWAGGTGVSGTYGMAISHIEPRQWVYGPEKNGAASYYINPVGIQYMAISAKELGSDTVLTTADMTAFSVRVELRPNASKAAAQQQPLVSFPLVQGMAFVTAIFQGGTPVVQTGVFFRTVTRANADPKPDVAKFRIVLEDRSTWFVYAYRTAGPQLELTVVNNGYAVAGGPFYGVVQVCKYPGGAAAEALYDDAAGVYATDAELSGSVSTAQATTTHGSYSINFQREGHAQGNLAMFALPHHVDSFDDETRTRLTAVRLQTPTKGVAVAVTGERWTMNETLPASVGFAPWSEVGGTATQLSAAARAAIAAVARTEISQNMTAQTDVNSVYFAGKALAKFAQIIYVVHEMLGDKGLAQSGLEKLKEAFARFSGYKNQFPLVYDGEW